MKANATTQWYAWSKSDSYQSPEAIPVRFRHILNQSQPSDEIDILWVQKRDGRLVAFDPDRITSTVFKAASSTSYSDPFLSRDLGESALHFLRRMATSSTISSATIKDVVVSVVQELGYPAIANALAEWKSKPGSNHSDLLDSNLAVDSSSDVDSVPVWKLVAAGSRGMELVRLAASRSLRQYSLSRVYAPDVAGACEEELLLIDSLDAPLEFECVSMKMPLNLGEAIHSLGSIRDQASQTVFFMKPQLCPGGKHPLTQDLLSAMDLLLASNGIHGLVPIRTKPVAEPASSSDMRLFQGLEQESVAQMPDDWQPVLSLLETNGLAWNRLHWACDLSESSFCEPDRSHLMALAFLILRGLRVHVRFRRQSQQEKQSHPLDAEAVLLSVGLNLGYSRLLGAVDDLDGVLRKLSVLGRICISAGRQKREFLRSLGSRQAADSKFLLDRSVMLVYLMGLDAISMRIYGKAVVDDPTALSFACKVNQELDRLLRTEGQRAGLDVRLVSPPYWLEARSVRDGMHTLNPSEDSPVSTQKFLRMIGALHASPGHGSVTFTREHLINVDAAMLVEMWQFCLEATSVNELVHLPATKKNEHEFWEGG